MDINLVISEEFDSMPFNPRSRDFPDLRNPERQLDLGIIFILILSTLIFVLMPPLSTTPIRIALGILFILFIPGYLLVAALFPGKGDLDGIERIALSFGLSIAVVPLLGLILNYTPWGIRLNSILTILSLYSIILVFAAYYRRTRLPEKDRFSVPFYKIGISLRQEIFGYQATAIDRVLTGALILSIILALSMVVYVIITPKIGERFTEFYILDMNGTADNYPTTLIPGKAAPLLVGVVNHEYHQLNYTVRAVLDGEILADKWFRLNHNETWEQPITLIPRKTGTDLKLEFLLYKEDNFTAPYRSLHLWVKVTG